MRRTLIRFSAMVMFCLCGIGLVTNVLSAGIPDNAKGLAALDNEWSKAATAGDVDKVVSFYADDAIAYPPNAPAVTDHAAIKDAWAKMLADPKSKLSWKTTNAGVDHNTGFTSGNIPGCGIGRRGGGERQISLRVAQGGRRKVEGHPRHVEQRQ